MQKIVKKLGEYFKSHYLLHVILDDMHVNIYINTTIGRWVAQQKSKGSRAVIVGAWPISTADYLSLKRS